MKRKLKEKTKKVRPDALTDPAGSPNQGIQDTNRVDSRVIKYDLKRSPIENFALVSALDVPMLERRNNTVVEACLRKAKQVVPRKTVKDRGLNLGSLIRVHPLGRIRPRGPLSGYVSKMLKQRTDKSLSFLVKCQELLKGTAFDTHFIYLLAVPYCKHARGLSMCYRTPSLGATRLLLQQLLRCESNFPWERLYDH